MKDYSKTSPEEIWKLIRSGEIDYPTAGMCAGYAQANLVILPKKYAEDFKEFARKNPKPCPILEVVEGTPDVHDMGEGSNIVTDIPRYFTAGNYEAEIGIRYQESYPYRDIWLEVSHNTKDTLTYVTDTLQLFLVDEAGNKTGNGLCGLYQCDLPYKASIPIRTEGSARTFRIVHIMTDNPLTGISDIGIRLRKPENQ